MSDSPQQQTTWITRQVYDELCSYAFVTKYFASKKIQIAGSGGFLLGQEGKEGRVIRDLSQFTLIFNSLTWTNPMLQKTLTNEIILNTLKSEIGQVKEGYFPLGTYVTPPLVGKDLMETKVLPGLYDQIVAKNLEGIEEILINPFETEPNVTCKRVISAEPGVYRANENVELNVIVDASLIDPPKEIDYANFRLRILTLMTEGTTPIRHLFEKMPGLEAEFEQAFKQWYEEHKKNIGSGKYVNLKIPPETPQTPSGPNVKGADGTTPAGTTTPSATGTTAPGATGTTTPRAASTPAPEGVQNNGKAGQAGGAYETAQHQGGVGYTEPRPFPETKVFTPSEIEAIIAEVKTFLPKSYKDLSAMFSRFAEKNDDRTGKCIRAAYECEMRSHYRVDPKSNEDILLDITARLLNSDYRIADIKNLARQQIITVPFAPLVEGWENITGALWQLYSRKAKFTHEHTGELEIIVEAVRSHPDMKAVETKAKGDEIAFILLSKSRSYGLIKGMTYALRSKKPHDRGKKHGKKPKN